MDDNKDVLDMTEETTDEVQDSDISEEIPLATDDAGNYYPSTYVVYGMAAGLAAGAVLMAMTDSRLLLSACVFLGTLIGYFIKKKDPKEGDSHEK